MLCHGLDTAVCMISNTTFNNYEIPNFNILQKDKGAVD